MKCNFFDIGELNISNPHVFVFRDKGAEYFNTPPFHPFKHYPEYPFTDRDISKKHNRIYEMVRECFHGTGLDISNYGTANWNPLKKIIAQGDTVLIKPNLVVHKHKFDLKNGLKSIITDTSLVRVIIDYVVIALQGKGKIIIGDAPIQFCEFETLVSTQGYDRLIQYYQQKGVDISLQDFRLYKSLKTGNNITPASSTMPNPRDLIAVDLKNLSQLHDIRGKHTRFRVTNYNPVEMLKHHNEIKHQYLINKSVLQADVIINIPKLKTHRKAGITCALKNIVGINGLKDCLPHHTRGAISQGGDEYLYKNFFKEKYMDIQEIIDVLNIKRKSKKAKLLRMLQKPMGYIMRRIRKDSFMEGSWYGNDTIWRTVLDLNSIMMYADKHGKLQNEVQRKYAVFVDGIIAGEGEGPLVPTPKKCGIIAMGWCPVVVDSVMAVVTGFDFEKIPLIRNGFRMKSYQICKVALSEIRIHSNWSVLDGKGIYDVSRKDSLKFQPTSGWSVLKNNVLK